MYTKLEEAMKILGNIPDLERHQYSKKWAMVTGKGIITSHTFHTGKEEVDKAKQLILEYIEEGYKIKENSYIGY